MIELILHFIGADPSLELAMHQETHVAGIYETMDECNQALINFNAGEDPDIAFMNDGIVDRVLAMDGIAHVLFINYCAEPEPEMVS